MAKIKLSDVIEVMKSKWTYGDSIFGYTEEFNDNHKFITCDYTHSKDENDNIIEFGEVLCIPKNWI